MAMAFVVVVVVVTRGSIRLRLDAGETSLVSVMSWLVSCRKCV